MLTGYKTYICTALGVIDVVAMFLGYVSINDGLLALGVLGFGSVAALRSALKTDILALIESTNLPAPTNTTL